jgi:cytochrome c oxidase subunit 2
MWPNAPLFPDQGSALASEVDHLFLYALGGAVFFSSLIAVLVVFFAVRYRRRAPDQIGVNVPASKGTLLLEVAWSGIPLALMLSLFGWGAKVFFAQNRPPANAVQYTVVGKQWMWKIQHPEGNREINELHVPVGRAVKLLMTSEDVIHDFFVPAFRIHVDVLPNRYTTYWFQANRVGTYRFFCGQYCGVEHSKMAGTVYVMEPHDYEVWLSGGKPGQAPLASGEEIFVAHACNTCHRPDSSARAPLLNGFFGKSVPLADGKTVVADENYIRESILEPKAKVVAGYQPIMPTFKGTLSEEELMLLVNYVKSLSPESKGASSRAAEAGAAPGAGMNPARPGKGR